MRMPSLLARMSPAHTPSTLLLPHRFTQAAFCLATLPIALMATPAVAAEDSAWLGADFGTARSIHAIDPEFFFAAMVAVTTTRDLGAGGSFRLSVPVLPGATAKARGALEAGAGFLRDEEHAIWAGLFPISAAVRVQLGQVEIGGRGGLTMIYVGTEQLNGSDEFGAGPMFGLSTSLWLPAAQFAVELGLDVHLMSSTVAALSGGIAF